MVKNIVCILIIIAFFGRFINLFYLEEFLKLTSFETSVLKKFYTVIILPPCFYSGWNGLKCPL